MADRSALYLRRATQNTERNATNIPAWVENKPTIPVLERTVHIDDPSADTTDISKFEFILLILPIT